MESPFFQGHVLVNADTVLLVFGIHKDHHPNGLNRFMNQHVAEFEEAVRHANLSRWFVIEVAGRRSYESIERWINAGRHYRQRNRKSKLIRTVCESKKNWKIVRSVHSLSAITARERPTTPSPFDQERHGARNNKCRSVQVGKIQP